MGATLEPVAALPCRGGEPPGEDVEVRLDCWAFSNNAKLAGFVEDGEDVLFARDRCCCG
jgi:hypothetical protein